MAIQKENHDPYLFQVSLKLIIKNKKGEVPPPEALPIKKIRHPSKTRENDKDRRPMQTKRRYPIGPMNKDNLPPI